MRLVTTCPQCAAAFYVTSGQLAAHRGDVRCGKCEHVFNALDRLAEIDDAQAEETASHESFDEVETVPKAELAAPEESVLEFPFQAEVADHPEAVSENTPPVQPVFNITDFSVPPAADILSPSMMDDAAKNKTGGANKSGFVRFMMALFVLLLILAALGQTAYFLRSDIAARWPQARPHLEQACTWLRCNVTLPQNIDLIMIDDSDLKEDTERLGLIHLSTTLVNRADYSQALPLLELTLTDANDKPLLRRSFGPAEYLPAGGDIRRGIAARGRLDIRLALTAEGADVAGYRLFVTY